MADEGIQYSVRAVRAAGRGSISATRGDAGAERHRRYVLQIDVPGGSQPAVHAQVDAVLARVAHDLQLSLPDATSSVELLAPLVRAAEATVRRNNVPRLEVDLEARRIFVGEQIVQLAFKEFEILRLLLARPGEVVGRDEIAAGIGDGGERPAPRTIDVHVHRIRTKLGATGDCIATVRGVGYRFQPSTSVLVT